MRACEGRRLLYNTPVAVLAALRACLLPRWEFTPRTHSPSNTRAACVQRAATGLSLKRQVLQFNTASHLLTV